MIMIQSDHHYSGQNNCEKTQFHYVKSQPEPVNFDDFCTGIAVATMLGYLGKIRTLELPQQYLNVRQI